MRLTRKCYFGRLTPGERVMVAIVTLAIMGGIYLAIRLLLRLAGVA